MKSTDLRIGWRSLVQEPGYSIVVVLGLAVGLAACLLLLAFVRYSLQYDRHVPDVENVYVVKHQYNMDPRTPWFDQAPYVLREAALKVPGVVDATGVALWIQPHSVRVEGQLKKVKGFPVMPGFAKMLGLEAAEGDLDSALEKPETVAITEEAAVRLFGTGRALGRTMQAEDKVVRIGAVIRNPPATTTIPFEALVGVNSVLVPDYLRKEMTNGNGSGIGKILIRVAPGSSLPAITEALQRVVDESPGVQRYPAEMMERLGKRKVMDIKLAPLRDAYFDTEVAENPINPTTPRGNPLVIGGLAAVALLILALAAFNYVNLATVRVLRRQREIGMRKVLGAGARQLTLQFLAESMAVSMLATAGGLLLAWLMLPVFSELMNRKLEGVFSPINLLASVAIGLLVGWVSAAYPAWIAVRVRPGIVLAGRPGSESASGRRLRLIMTVLQFSVAIALASIALAVAWQTRFAMNLSPGFDPDQLLIVDVPEQVKNSEKAQSLMRALSGDRSIASVTVMADAVGRFEHPWGLDFKREGGKPVFVDMKSVSTNFFEQYRIQPVAGRLFDPRIDKDDDAEPIVLDRVAVRAFGFASDEAAVGQLLYYTSEDTVNGQRISRITTKRIVGIAPELRFYPLHQAPHPTAYELWTLGTTLSVRAAGGLADAERAIRSRWPGYFPDAMVRITRAREIFASSYAEEARIAKLLSIATAVALLIAAFGMYVLSAHTVQRRAKEIVLRKLYGAGRRDVGRLIMRESGLLLIVSACIGLPLAALAIERFLSLYVEHVPAIHWVLPASLVAASVIALTAAARHVVIAMNMKPAAALRV